MEINFSNAINNTRIFINSESIDSCSIINNFFLDNYINMFYAILVYTGLTFLRYLFIKAKQNPIIDIPSFFIFKAESIDLFNWLKEISVYYIFINIIRISALILWG